jgi:hypothetical protein
MFSQMLSNVYAAVIAAMDQSACPQAIRILTDAFPGVSEPRLITALVGAGLTLHSQARFEEAEKHYRLAVVLYEKCFPEAHTEALTAARLVVEVLQEQGNAAGAEAFARQVQAVTARAEHAHRTTLVPA